MAKKNKDDLRHALVARLKKVLGEKATKELVSACQPKQLDKLKPGQDFPTVAELLIDKILVFALDAQHANQWAVELVWSYIEGRPVQGLPKRDDGRHIEEHLNDITREHFNSIAATIDENRPTIPPAPDTEDRTPGPASKLMDLPGHEFNGPKKAEAKSLVAIGAAPAGV